MAHTFVGRWFRVLWLPVLAGLLWLGLILGLYSRAARVDEEHRLELERIRLSTVARQLLDARNWNAAHGGVYVPESDLGRPNPWLPLHERTLKTADGRTLVLMNPAYMSRQLAERTSWPGISISIIGRRPLRPENQSDTWEGEALIECTEGRQEIFSPPDENGQGRLRLLTVLVAQQSCLRCHADSRVGEVLGGISVSQDAGPYLHNAAKQEGNMRLLYALLGVTGVLAIGGLTLNLTRRRWQAEETSRMKSAFMARLSHDMRTPLTAILGMSDLLQRGDGAAPEKKRALRYLVQAGGALLEMVSDITDHAALEQGTLALHESAFSLRAALSQCLELYRPAAASKGLRLELDVPSPVPDNLYGDAFRLRQALGNLVGNALKFTEQGGVRLEVEAESARTGRLLLRLRVRDSGPGLQPGELERIFESFQRGSHAGCQPGTGLGLNIARTIARRMGGDVRVSSQPGQGSCFTLEVLVRTDWGSARPCPPADADRNAVPESGAAGRGALEGRRILAAEDNPASRYFLEQTLRREGARAVVTADGEATLAALGEEEWDVVLLDARMPGPDGLDVLERIRQGRTGAPAGQCVVLYTAALDAEAQERCRRLRPDDILFKPVSFALLRQRLAALPTARGNGATLTQEDTSVPEKNISVGREKTIAGDGRANTDDIELPPWDREAALAAMDGDAAIFAHLLAVLRDDLGKMLDQLVEAVAAGDRKNIRRLAHACKNSAGTMRLMRLHGAAALTEKAEDAALDARAGKLERAMREALALLEAVDGGSGTETETRTAETGRKA